MPGLSARQLPQLVLTRTPHGCVSVAFQTPPKEPRKAPEVALREQRPLPGTPGALPSALGQARAKLSALRKQLILSCASSRPGSRCRRACWGLLRRGLRVTGPELQADIRVMGPELQADIRLLLIILSALNQMHLEAALAPDASGSCSSRRSKGLCPGVLETVSGPQSRPLLRVWSPCRGRAPSRGWRKRS